MSESLARLVVTPVSLEGRSKAEVARSYGVSRQWVHELVRRHATQGEAGLVPRSRRPLTNARRVPIATEDAIVALRKELDDQGLDAGAHTIAYHLEGRGVDPPSVATIWRVLTRRGFVTPQPQKRPKAASIRFSAEMPNERWQEDTTHWALADGTSVEILNAIDDHSRFLVGSDARVVFKAADVVTCLHGAAAAHGYPAELLTDNGAVFTAAPRGGRCALELECDRLGIRDINSRPYHPQTCGKVERFIRRRSDGWPSRSPRPRSSSSKRSSIGSAPTTTRSDPTGRSGGARRRRSMRPGPRTSRGVRGSRAPTGSGGIGSTAAARSRFATTPGSCTSRSAGATRGCGCSFSSPARTCGS